ncbi:MAG TPA: FkbM family methyltransferase [Candidatus Eisenbacteria bacterium]|nr:FkbM family methyltransferase [Candidatus Eisenbacteria bacterium]
MQALKNALKRTFLYDALRREREKRALRRWTAHDDEMAAFYSAFVSRGGLCFDVGANVGNRVKIFLALGARVVAVEPQDDCVRMLRAIHGRNPSLVILPQVLGAAEGEAEIMLSDASTISSMSPQWVEAVRSSGRFAGHRWDRAKRVAMTTLDRLIAAHGMPSFIKIDVEGFESEVLKGLTRPVAALSFEFTPEFLDAALACVEHLRRLGDVRFNFALGESMRLELPEWVPAEEAAARLTRWRGDAGVFGDVYARFIAPGEPAR